MDILRTALTQYGVTEIRGGNHNPTIVKYSSDIGYKGVIDDETAWCSIFINWCAMKAGLERSKKLNARSWIDIGEEIQNPQPGDVVVFWRGSPDAWTGHVALIINYSEDKRFIYCLGGNQNNQVKVSPYSVDKLLTFRRLNKSN